MRRLARWLLNALTVLSLLLSVATAGLWVRSYFVADRLVWTRRAYEGPTEGRVGWFELDTWCGRIGGHVEMNSAYSSPPLGWSHDAAPVDVAEPIVVSPPQSTALFSFPAPPFYHVYVDRAGFGYYRNDGAFYPRHFGFAPLWFLTAVTAAGPLLAARTWVRKLRLARRQSGHCPQCSYDLTGNVSGVCPECGTKVATLPG